MNVSTRAASWSRPVAFCVLAVLGLSSAATSAAQPIDRGHFEDSSSEVIDGFCGDLTVREDFTVRVGFLGNRHGPNGLGYFMETIHHTTSWTNLANNLTFTEVGNRIVKDLRVTDNGDGTLTVLAMTAGNFKVLGPDGRMLFRDTGQLRFALLVDNAGTPADPSDDFVIENLGIVKEDTGRNDLEGRSFCDDIHQFIG